MYKNMNTFEKWQIVVSCIQIGILLATFCGAFYIGLKANEINDRMRVLQDYVAVALIPDSETVKLLNVGKVNLYLWGFEMPGNSHHFDRPRLLPAGTNDSAYYWVGPPDVTKVKDNKFDIKLYLTDEFGNKLVTYGGGDLTKTRVLRDNKEVDAVAIKVWTYETIKKVWAF